MYSLAPLLNVENSHLGFYVSSIFFLVFTIGRCIKLLGIDLLIVAVVSLIYATITFVSFNVDTSKTYKNEKVTADFVSFMPEQTSYQCGGKHRRTCYSSVIYGEFKVPEGIVVLEINPAYPMPKRVTLYKN